STRTTSAARPSRRAASRASSASSRCSRPRWWTTTIDASGVALGTVTDGRLLEEAPEPRAHRGARIFFGGGEPEAAGGGAGLGAPGAPGPRHGGPRPARGEPAGGRGRRGTRGGVGQKGGDAPGDLPRRAPRLDGRPGRHELPGERSPADGDGGQAAPRGV